MNNRHNSNNMMSSLVDADRCHGRQTLSRFLSFHAVFQRTMSALLGSAGTKFHISWNLMLSGKQHTTAMCTFVASGAEWFACCFVAQCIVGQRARFHYVSTTVRTIPEAFCLWIDISLHA